MSTFQKVALLLLCIVIVIALVSFVGTEHAEWGRAALRVLRRAIF